MAIEEIPCLARKPSQEFGSVSQIVNRDVLLRGTSDRRIGGTEEDDRHPVRRKEPRSIRLPVAGESARTAAAVTGKASQPVAGLPLQDYPLTPSSSERSGPLAHHPKRMA